MIEFKPGVPLGNQLDILQSMIRQKERSAAIAREKRLQLSADIEQYEGEICELREQFKTLSRGKQ